MAKKANLKFLDDSKFSGITESVKQVLKNMLRTSPEKRVSSIQILSMLKVAIPIISQQELNRIQNEKPGAYLKINHNYSNVLTCNSVLVKRPHDVLKTPDVTHDTFYSNISKSFAFPVLDMSKKPSGVSDNESINNTLLKIEKNEFFSSDNTMLNDFIKMHQRSKNEQFPKLKRNKKSTSEFFIKSKSNPSKCLLNSKIPFKLDNNIRLCKKSLKDNGLIKMPTVKICF